MLMVIIAQASAFELHYSHTVIVLATDIENVFVLYCLYSVLNASAASRPCFALTAQGIL